MSGMNTSKKVSPEYEVISDPYSDIRNKTSSWLTGELGKKATPYSGETQSLGELDKYVNQPKSEMTGLAQDEIKKTLTGGYDPTTSPYYQAVKAESARDLENTISGISSDAAGGGRYWTGARLDTQGTARTDSGIALNKLLGELTLQERQNKLTAAQQAQSLGTEETNLPLQKATALQSLGSLTRNLQQAQDEAVYNEWLRQQSYPLQIAQLASPYALQQPVLGQVGYEPSNASMIWNNIAPYTSIGSGVASQSKKGS
jgi:hypothetical protein